MVISKEVVDYFNAPFVKRSNGNNVGELPDFSKQVKNKKSMEKAIESLEEMAERYDSSPRQRVYDPVLFIDKELLKRPENTSVKSSPYREVPGPVRKMTKKQRFVLNIIIYLAIWFKIPIQWRYSIDISDFTSGAGSD